MRIIILSLAPTLMKELPSSAILAAALLALCVVVTQVRKRSKSVSTSPTIPLNAKDTGSPQSQVKRKLGGKLTCIKSSTVKIDW